MPKKSSIYTLSTSICGALHKAKNLPCQDYCFAKKTKNKLVAIAADGAGSAKYSKIGARIICETLCNILIRSNMQNIRTEVIKAIECARQKLIFHRYNKTKNSRGLLDFSATIVGVFCYKNQGIFFHIGDGAAIAYQKDDYQNLVISEPENGAFSCETYFFTMPDWQHNLRFTEFNEKNRILLITDGVTGFVFSDDFFNIQRKFLIPILEYLEQEPRKTYAEQALKNTLNDKKAQRINPDDKTFFWAKLP